MTFGAQQRVSTPANAEAVTATYHGPQWTAPIPGSPGMLRYRRGNCELRVRVHDGTVCFVAFHTDAETPCPSLATPPTTRTRHRRRGGAGTIWPTTWRELRTRLRAAGCHLYKRGKHWHAELPNGATYTFPHTASDHRALRNAAHDLAAHGVDTRRENGRHTRRQDP